MREPAGLAGPENLSPGCALALPSGGCISYRDVDAAFGQAAESLPFQPLKFPPTGNFSNEEIGSLGTVIHEATRVLAKVTTKYNRQLTQITNNVKSKSYKIFLPNSTIDSTAQMILKNIN